MVTRITENSNSEKNFRERETLAQIKQAFETRQLSPLYKDMLVSLGHCIFLGVFTYSMQSRRDKLPIAQYRNEIMRQLEVSQVLVLSGETGWLARLNIAIFLP